MKVFIFANCHGALYKNALMKSDKSNRLDIEHVISYENLAKFTEIKSKFETCDVLIIQPIQNYELFKIDNLKPLLKKSCVIIRVPFIRFDGFWDEYDVRNLKKFKSPAVMFFPKIFTDKEVSAYLHGTQISEKLIVENFNASLVALKDLEHQGDVKFYDFIIKHYQTIPLFRDSYHPTRVLYDYISSQIVLNVKQYCDDLVFSEFEIPYSSTKEYGHFKPITNKVASVLNLKYDLNSYFMFTRYDYLSSIIKHENDESAEVINDLNGLSALLKRRIITSSV